MLHLYLSYQPSSDLMSKELSDMEKWSKENGISEYNVLEEHIDTRRISERQIIKLLSGVRPCDVVLTTSLTRLGRGLNMLIKVLTILRHRGASLITINDNKHYSPEDIQTLIDALSFGAEISTAIRTERNAESAVTAQRLGHFAGRPVGSKKSPERNVLFGKEDILKKLRSDGLSDAVIGAQLGVSRSTVRNYRMANGIV